VRLTPLCLAPIFFVAACSHDGLPNDFAMPVDGSPGAFDLVSNLQPADMTVTLPDLGGPHEVPPPRRVVCACNNGTVVADCAFLSCDEAADQAGLCSADCNGFGGGAATKCLDTDVTCTPVFPGPSLVQCNCESRVVSTCAQVDCASGPQKDAVCRYLCFSIGHEVSADCTADAIACR